MSETQQMSFEQKVQDVQYEFPYHYLVSCGNGNFSQSRSLSWGYIYWSYVEYVCGQAAQIDPENVVEIGCGDGRVITEMMRRKIGKTHTGIDYSGRAIALARALNEGVRFLCIDITDSAGKSEDDPLWGKYDLAILVEVLEHIHPDETAHFIESVRAALRPGGRLIVTVPSVNKPLNKKHFRHFDGETVKSILEPFFQVDRMQFINGTNRLVRTVFFLISNQTYSISSARIWMWFYKLYKKRCLVSDPGRGNRIFVQCTRA